MSSQSPTPFIPAAVRVDSSHSEVNFYATQTAEALKARWNTEEGKRILEAWEGAQFDRKILAGLVGVFYDNLDARGAPLKLAKASGADLSHIDMFSADCRDAEFKGGDLTGSFLSEADIRGADFSWAKMDGAFLDSAKFDEKTKFLGVNLNAVNFNLAALLRERAITQQRVADLENRYPLLAFFLSVTCDYGRSFGRWSLWVAGTIVVFAVLFWTVPGATNAKDPFDAFYFAVVTFTTLGYGDILPVSVVGKAMAVAEVSIGYVMGGLLIAILTRKVLGS